MEQKIEIEEIDLEKMLMLVHKYTGITMNSSKKALLQTRLRPRVRKLELKSFNEYLDYLEHNKEEIQNFINAITTNETQFFRTPRIWDYFMNEFLPEWHKENKGKTLQIWSGASSTGEEAFTLGICCEDFKLKNKNFNYQVSGSDISTNVLAEAEKGIYSGRSIENFRTNYPQLFEKFMKSTGEEYRVVPEIFSRVKFYLHNLYSLPKEKSAFDIIFLRNVLIYFTPTDQEIVLRNLSHALVKNGILIIGESESLHNLKVPFTYMKPLIYQKTGV